MAWLRKNKEALLAILNILFGGSGVIILNFVFQQSPIDSAFRIAFSLVFAISIIATVFFYIKVKENDNLIDEVGKLKEKQCVNGRAIPNCDYNSLTQFYGLQPFIKNDRNIEKVTYNDFNYDSGDSPYPVQYKWCDSRGTNNISSRLMEINNEKFLRILVNDTEGVEHQASNIAIKPKSNKPQEFCNIKFIVIRYRLSKCDLNDKVIKDNINPFYFNIRIVDRFHRHYKCKEMIGGAQPSFSLSNIEGWNDQIIDINKYHWDIFKFDGNSINFGVPANSMNDKDFSVITSIVFCFGKKSESKVMAGGLNIIDLEKIEFCQHR